MRTCSRCGQEKDHTEFAARRGTGKQPWCRACNREYASAYYAANRSRLVPAINARKVERKAANRRFKQDYLAGLACVDCGESDPVVLDFDHVRGTKYRDVSFLISQGYSEQTIRDEIAKCDVVCANCHRKRTARRW